MAQSNILITGSTSGIGLSLVKLYATSGHQVIACGRSQDKLDELDASLSNIRTVCFDITNEQQINNATSNIEALDVIVLNAGDCLYMDNVKQFDANVFSKVININLVSMGYVLSALLPKLKTGGQLVFISSSATILPFPRAEAYGASKAGVDYLANSLRVDLAQQHIDVTLIHPGFIKTPLTDKNTFDMPFMLSSEQAALRIHKAIQKRATYSHFPKRFTFILKLLSCLPYSWWSSFASKRLVL